MTTQEALALIAEIFEELPENVQYNTPRSEIPAWDSLGMLSLMASLDENFDIRLTEDQLSEITKVGDVLEILRQKDMLSD